MKRFRCFIALLALVFLSLTFAQPSNVRADAAANISELIFTAVQNTTSPAQAVTITNTGAGSIDLTAAQLIGTNPTAFTLTNPPGGSIPLAPGASTTFNIAFNPPAGANGVHLSAALRVTTSDAITPTLDVGLHGLSLQGLEGGNEPGLQAVVNTLGYAVNVGGNGLVIRPLPENLTPLGDEINIQLFQRANPGPVSMIALARFSPAEALPFGYYFPDGTNIPPLIEVNRIQNSAVNPINHQTLNPLLVGGGTSFDPGTFHFGFYITSLSFGRSSYTQDGLNTGARVRAARSFIARDRSGSLLPNTYLLTFEDANNGDYQDYVFLISNVTPAIAEPPIAAADSSVTPQDTPITIDLVANDSGVDAPLDPATAALVAQPPAAEGVVTLNGGAATFTPAPGFSGTSTFMYTVQDAIGQISAPATVTVQVDPPPVVPPPGPPPNNPPQQPQTSSSPASQPATAVVSAQPAAPVGGFTISKSASPPIASAGDEVTFSIVLRNTGSQAFDVFNLEDTLPEAFEILDAQASAGAPRIVGQQVHFSLNALGPGAMLTLTVRARIRAGVNTPALVTEACAGAANLAATCAQATVLSVSRLPATGQTPLWRTPLLRAGIVGLMALVAGMILLRRSPKPSPLARSVRQTEQVNRPKS